MNKTIHKTFTKDSRKISMVSDHPLKGLALPKVFHDMDALLSNAAKDLCQPRQEAVLNILRLSRNI